MSKCKKHRHEMGMGYGFPNLFTIIILILIVLQWFRVGGYPAGVAGAAGPGPGGYPETGLMGNGGLFIIALFILIACSCFKGMEIEPMEHHKHRC